jgi:type IV pilus assembly protein PilP
MRVVSLAPVAFASMLAACGVASSPAAVGSSQSNLPSPAPIEAQASEAPRPSPAPIPFDAIVEGPSSRDPFRAFRVTLPPPQEDVRPRKARRVPVEQLKLVALVTHTSVPRAVLVDPSGRGYIVTTGELVGRPEIVGERAASFRVDRIREGDVVLVREDSAEATRVLSMPPTPLLQIDD